MNVVLYDFRIAVLIGLDLAVLIEKGKEKLDVS